MILHFPNLNALKFSLTSGLLPEAVVAAPAEFATNEEGRVWVQFPVELTPAQLSELKAFGATERKTTRGASTDFSPVTCWPQILPLEKLPNAQAMQNATTERTPVLFELPDDADMGELVSEMLRLGNDRQSFRQQQTPEGVRTLLQVKGPPYYTLLRAIDRLDGPATPRAYIEQQPRVWVEYGYSHPLVEPIQPASGTMLLLAAPRTWTAIPEGKFRDIYEVLKFTIPAQPSRWEAGQLAERLKVRLRLVRSGSDEPAEFWVLNHAGLRQLEELVQSSDDRLISRLAFAVGTSAETGTEPVIVVKVRPGKEPPPVLVLDGIPCRSYLRIPNLFLPLGHRLHPPLRRDAVKQLLAADANNNTWLLPEADGQFVPQSLPDNAFRPLTDWVDYVLDVDREALSVWMESMQFDFESFACPDEAADRPNPTQRRSRETEETVSKRKESHRPSNAAMTPATQKSRSTKTQAVRRTIPPLTIVPSELQKKLQALENAFRERPEPWDSPAREDQWRELAELNMALGNRAQAAICHVNGLWEQQVFSAEWIRDWFEEETQNEALPLSGEAFEAVLSADRPTPPQINLLAVHIIAAGFREEEAVDISMEQLSKAQCQLERHEYFLPARMAWLSWLGFVKLAQNDLLLLARSRDRILERIYQQGLSSELDLPAFLRSLGPREGERFREVQAALKELRERIQSWIQRELEDRGPSSIRQTAAYADLMLAYGYSRAGMGQECLDLVKQAQTRLFKGNQGNAVHEWLFEAFRHRIEQSLQGECRMAALPEHLMKPLAEKTMSTGLAFVIESLRSKSAILQPMEPVDSHARVLLKKSHLRYEVEHLSNLEDREELAARVRELLDKHGGDHSLDESPEGSSPSPLVSAKNETPTYQVLLAALLPLAPRLGEALANELLSEVDPTLRRLSHPCEKAMLLDKALLVAGHFGQAVHVGHFLEEVSALFEHASSAETAGVFGELLEQSFRGLRKLGMRDEISRLLEKIDHLLKSNRFAASTASAPKPRPRKTVNSPGKRKKAKRPEGNLEAMSLRLSLAAGWFYFGNDERAQAILGEVTSVLYDGEALASAKRRKLAQRYALALEHAPPEIAIPKLLEIFDRLRGITKGKGAGMQDPYYAYEVLEVTEPAILALVSDDMALDPKAKRLMEELEFATRRRIHRDMDVARRQNETIAQMGQTASGHSS